MKIVVTGALGHIGSHVIRELPTQFPGASIVMIDNMMTQRFPSLFNLPSAGSYRFIEGDVTKMELRSVFEGARVVIHLAAIADAASSFEKAALVETNNFQCTVQVAEACAQVGARLITLSSTSVYGTQNAVVSEDCTPDELKPQSPYAETKLKEEEMVGSLVAQRGLRAAICRFGTIFGTSPGMRFHTAVNKFCWQAVMGEPITVWRTAYEQKRPYLDLEDAGRAIGFIIANDVFDGRVYNVLTTNATVRQIVETIGEFVPGLKVHFVDARIMNQLSYEVSSRRFEERGFRAAGDLRRGIGRTVSLLGGANRNSSAVASS
jgi:nucleoside-diphosphate-sugar epimerase